MLNEQIKVNNNEIFLNRVLDIVSFANSKKQKNKYFFKELKNKLDVIDDSYYKEFSYIEDMFKTLEFLREIDDINNHINYDLLDFQNLKNTKKELLNEFVNTSKSKLDRLKTSFLKKVENTIDKVDIENVDT